MKFSAPPFRLASFVALCLCCLVFLLNSGTAQTSVDRPNLGGVPEWAYGTGPAEALKPLPPLAPAQKDAADNALQHLPGTELVFSRKQANDPFHPADWYPGDHPAMPPVVADGRKPAGIWACALCHLPNGKGKPENAPVAGLPVSYFVHQMQDFRNGNRRSTDDRKGNTKLMIAYAKAMTDAEIQQAAEYYAAVPWSAGTNPWVKVVEADTVPHTHLSAGLYVPNEEAGTEPLGDRIIEVPQRPERTEVQRDPHSGFIAYVPFGTLEKGKALVEDGGHGATEACAICHGEGLHGLGPVPGIAGRPASYTARQLFDIQHGARKGEWSELMKSVVARLTPDQILQISAYTASLPSPPPAAGSPSQSVLPSRH
jgi:cytochrome c553